MYSLTEHDELLQLMEPPYSITDQPGRRVITLTREAVDHPALAVDPETSCLEHVGLLAVEIDCAAINQANSLLIAWIIRVAQAVQPRRVTLVGVNERQAVLFRRMRLDHLVDLSPESAK